MNLEDIQIALFSAYDIRNAMTSSDKRKQTENDNFGDSLEQIISFLEALEEEVSA